MGHVEVFDVLTALAGLEMVLADLGHPVTLGAGLRAAEEVLRK